LLSKRQIFGKSLEKLCRNLPRRSNSNWKTSQIPPKQAQIIVAIYNHIAAQKMTLRHFAKTLDFIG